VCVFQSMRDLSRVVNFFAPWVEDEGRGPKTVFGFRGPGLFIGNFCGSDDTVEVNEVEKPDVEGASCWVLPALVSPECSGHFFASGESSGTSTTSLAHNLLSTRNKKIVADIRDVFTSK
jgi:hypothetical protein